MKEIDFLIKKYNETGFSPEEIAYVLQRIKEAKPGDDADLGIFICLFGKVGGPEYRELIERFIDYPTQPWVSVQALNTLCTDWDLTAEYLPKVKEFIKGVDWDESDEVRLIALSIAGEYLRKTFEKELLQLLISFFEDLGKNDTFQEKRDYARAFLQSCAYQNLARAMGKEWEEIPDVDEIKQFIVSKQFHCLNLKMIRNAHEMLKDGFHILKDFDNLLKKHKENRLSAEEIADVFQEIKKAKPGDDEDIDMSICLLGQMGGPEYRELVEKFLDYPTLPYASLQALNTLCSDWGLTAEYLAEIKKFIRGVKWDESDKIRLTAIGLAGEFLRKTFDKELLQLLISMFEDFGKIDSHYERDESSREFLQSCAYQNLAIAMGKDWEEIPYEEVITECIKNKQFHCFDLEMLKKAHEMVQVS